VVSGDERGVISVDLFDVERVEAQLDAITERRAREARDASAVEELWKESTEADRERRREENAAAWRAYHLDQALRLEATASGLARDHRARAKALLWAEPGAA
jgi:hypothetical protein